MVAGRKFAAFDIDGTVMRWQLYHAIGDALAREGHITQETFATVRQSRMNWKRRAVNDGFSLYEELLVEAFDNALRGMEVRVFESIVEKVFEEYKEQVYTFTRDLIKQLKADNYLLFAISGSPTHIVKKFADYYGFDDFAATGYEIKGDHFTGVKNVSVGKKPQLLQSLIDKYGASLEESYAVGDSEGDIAMLAMVARPIAFNPTVKLYEQAKSAGWDIVIERKSVVYELKRSSDSYILG
jgi:HAD superfamily hydrolase (TIGR01490 family)